MPSRRIPQAVLRELRQEVGYRCPVKDCGNPYLMFHHFDPSWAQERHHRPKGMVALCQPHASQADHGAFTNEQLRSLKHDGARRAQAIAGQFNWMRQRLLAVIGGNYYLNPHVVLRVQDITLLAFERDEAHQVLLTFTIPGPGGLRTQIERNAWTIPPSSAAGVICPPSGRILEVDYHDGNALRIEFFEVSDQEAFARRYPANICPDGIFPITAVELTYESITGVLRSPIRFGPTSTNIGPMMFTGCYVGESDGVIFQIG